MTEHVTFSIEGSIATITLNRPQKLNAVTPEMADAITAYVERCNGDDAIRCVIITGAGEKAFCAGSDIGELDRYDTAWNFRNRPDYCDAIRSLLKPTIAAVNGYAFGGGLETAMSCDIRIASDKAQFAAPEIKLGWIGGGGMATFLAHSIGPSNAALMIMTGDPIQASQALAWGLVSEVVPRPDRSGNSEAQYSRGLRHVAREGDRVRTRSADDLLCHGGCRRRAGRLQREASAGVPPAVDGRQGNRRAEDV
jgi:enoyl-CoA hydratase/carnithine racemase